MKKFGKLFTLILFCISSIAQTYPLPNFTDKCASNTCEAASSDCGSDQSCEMETPKHHEGEREKHCGDSKNLEAECCCHSEYFGDGPQIGRGFPDCGCQLQEGPSSHEHLGRLAPIVSPRFAQIGIFLHVAIEGQGQLPTKSSPRSFKIEKVPPLKVPIYLSHQSLLI